MVYRNHLFKLIDRKLSLFDCICNLAKSVLQLNNQTGQQVFNINLFVLIKMKNNEK